MKTSGLPPPAVVSTAVSPGKVTQAPQGSPAATPAASPAPWAAPNGAPVAHGLPGTSQGTFAALPQLDNRQLLGLQMLMQGGDVPKDVLESLPKDLVNSMTRARLETLMKKIEAQATSAAALRGLGSVGY